MRYRPEIDGLRAIAVVPVILFHAGFGLFSGGFVGVDVFFVISGYLITAILLQDLDNGRYSIAQFYERRARRIIPALVVVVLATIPPAFLLMLPDQFERFAESIAAVGVFLSNFYFLSQVNYFAPMAELQPMLHTWSLAVEEQFYLLFPPLLALLWRKGTRWTIGVLAAIAVVSLCLAEWGWRENQARNFFFTGGRIWELMAGSLSAIVLHSRQIAKRDALSGVGLMMIIFAMIFHDASTPTPSLQIVLPVLGTVLIILFAGQETRTGQLLSFRPVVWIGLISYSAYLWHQPMFALARIHFVSEPPLWVMIVLTAAILPLSFLTWRFVEQPFRRRSQDGAAVQLLRRRVLGGSAAVLLAFLAFGIAGKSTEGFKTVWTNAFPQKAELAALVFRARTEALPQDDGACRVNQENVDTKLAERLLACRDKYGPGVAVLGDSHAIDLFGIVSSRDENRFVAGFTKPSCRPNTTDRECPYEGFRAFVAQNPGIFDLVIFEMSGAYLLSLKGGAPGVQNEILILPPDDVAPRLDPVLSEIKFVSDFLSDLNELLPVVWLGARIEPQVQLDWVVHLGCENSLRLRKNTWETFATLDEVASAAAQATDVPYLSQTEAIDLSFPADFGGCDGLFWSDGDHYSAKGEVILGQRADLVKMARDALAEY